MISQEIPDRSDPELGSGLLCFPVVVRVVGRGVGSRGRGPGSVHLQVGLMRSGWTIASWPSARTQLMTTWPSTKPARGLEFGGRSSRSLAPFRARLSSLLQMLAIAVSPGHVVGEMATVLGDLAEQVVHETRRGGSGARRRSGRPGSPGGVDGVGQVGQAVAAEMRTSLTLRSESPAHPSPELRVLHGCGQGPRTCFTPSMWTRRRCGRLCRSSCASLSHAVARVLT